MVGSKGRKAGRAWKAERASVSTKQGKKPRSNKYRSNDSDQAPNSRARSRAWVGGYTRADGTKVKGHYRELNSR